ncbi:MAG: hypothetical protein DMF71_03030 [Acidobacteria bacterium]|nr:MAG: hypothetical protein DMF71_03030 [Acidobacteriota bacterium]
MARAFRRLRRSQMFIDRRPTQIHLFSWAFCLIGVGIGALLIPGILMAIDRPWRSQSREPEQQIDF